MLLCNINNDEQSSEHVMNITLRMRENTFYEEVFIINNWISVQNLYSCNRIDFLFKAR